MPVRCPNCNLLVQETAKFCPNCGVDFARPAEPGTVLCELCGASFPDEDAEYVDGKLACVPCFHQAQRHADVRDRERARNSERYREGKRKGVQQRRTLRFEVEKCFVRLRKQGLAARLKGEHKPRMGPLIDLSTGGLQCVTEVRMKEGDRLTVELIVPAFEDPLSLEGQVCWERPDGNRRRIGIQFDKADAATQAHLEALEKHESLRRAASIREQESRRTSPEGNDFADDF